MRLSLLDDQILIRRAPPETTSAGGLHIPDRDAVLPLWGEVLAVGPGKAPPCACGVLAPMAVSVGDTVLHQRYAGTDVVIDGQPCLVLRAVEVLGILDETEGDTAGEQGR